MSFIELKNIYFEVNKRILFENISLAINQNDCIAFIGKNGSGKSTLLKLLAGLIKPTKGLVIQKSKKIGYVPEQPPKSLPFTPIEYLTHMGNIARVEKGLDRKIDTLLTQFYMEEYQNTNIRDLSKGNKQKVNIMQALLNNPELLLLDEPLSGLDSKAQTDLIGLLMNLKKDGGTIVFISHETVLLEKLADRIVHIDEQRIKEVANISSAVQSYATIECIVHSDSFPSFIQESSSIIDFQFHAPSTYELKVVSSKSDHIIKKILDFHGSIRFVSHTSDQPLK